MIDNYISDIWNIFSFFCSDIENHNDIQIESKSYYYIENKRMFEDAFYHENFKKIKKKGYQIIFEWIKGVFINKNKNYYEKGYLYIWNYIIQIYFLVLNYRNYLYIYGILSLNAQTIAPLSPYMIYWKNLKKLNQKKLDEALEKVNISLFFIINFLASSNFIKYPKVIFFMIREIF